MTGGHVERYLDEMFDRLAGTGADGRRLLMEVEDHLAESVAEGRAKGLDAETAELEAVRRFGDANGIVRRLPAAAGTVRISLYRLVTIAVTVAGTAATWYGLSGAVTWLLSWPWTRLLIATDRWGSHPMCERPWIPSNPVDCLSFHRQDLSAVPWGGPYPYFAGIGLFLLVTMLILRRTTAMGAPKWTPTRAAGGLTFALPFGLVGLLLIFYGVVGEVADAQDYGLSNLIAGLTAAIISVTAVRRLKRG